MFDLAAALFPDDLPLAERPGPFAPLQQSALYARAVRLLGARTWYVSLPGTGAWALRRKMPLLGDVTLISRGPPMLTAHGARTLPEAASSRHILVNAEDAASADALAMAGFWRIARPRQIADLWLTETPEGLAARMTGKWRNRLRHGLRQPLKIVRKPFPPTPRHWLFRAEADRARTLGYEPMAPAMVAALAAAQNGAGQLFTAYHGPDKVGAMLFLRHGRMATYQIGWTTSAGRSQSVGNLLMWRAMLELQGLGVERLDLGVADPALAPGLAHFKCGAGAELRRLGGTWMRSTALPRRTRSRSGADGPPPAPRLFRMSRRSRD